MRYFKTQLIAAVQWLDTMKKETLEKLKDLLSIGVGRLNIITMEMDIDDDVALHDLHVKFKNYLA